LFGRESCRKNASAFIPPDSKSYALEFSAFSATNLCDFYAISKRFLAARILYSLPLIRNGVNEAEFFPKISLVKIITNPPISFLDR
jgi:hypothetical protein